MSDMHRCRRVYADGTTELEMRSADKAAGRTLHGWREYNRLFRPGCALLVDGKVDTLGIGFKESERQRLESLYAADAQLDPCQGEGG